MNRYERFALWLIDNKYIVHKQVIERGEPFGSWFMYCAESYDKKEHISIKNKDGTQSIQVTGEGYAWHHYRTGNKSIESCKRDLLKSRDYKRKKWKYP